MMVERAWSLTSIVEKTKFFKDPFIKIKTPFIKIKAYFQHLRLDLRGRRGTFGTCIDVSGSLATNRDRFDAAAFCVTGVALSASHSRFAWQAWYFRYLVLPSVPLWLRDLISFSFLLPSFMLTAYFAHSLSWRCREWIAVCMHVHMCSPDRILQIWCTLVRRIKRDRTVFPAGFRRLDATWWLSLGIVSRPDATCWFSLDELILVVNIEWATN